MSPLKEEKIPKPPTEAELRPIIWRHSQKHRPLTFTQLQQRGELDEAIQTAAQLTLTATAQLSRRHHLDPWKAWELVREEWALLPAEEGPERAQERLPFLSEITELEDDQNLDVVIAADSSQTEGFAWPVCLAKCLRILGKLIGLRSPDGLG